MLRLERGTAVRTSPESTSSRHRTNFRKTKSTPLMTVDSSTSKITPAGPLGIAARLRPLSAPVAHQVVHGHRIDRGGDRVAREEQDLLAGRAESRADAPRPEDVLRDDLLPP